MRKTSEECVMNLQARAIPIAFAAIALAALLAMGICPALAHADTGSGAANVPLQAQGLTTQAVDYDTSWYVGKSSPYEIESIPALKGLAHLVNEEGITFEGETVKLAKSLAFVNTSIDPIGTEEHPFEGTFDGGRGSGSGIVEVVGEPAIQNLQLNVDDRLSNVGLFGYAGDKATIKNLSLRGGSIVVANSENGKRITDMGTIAGYLGGSLENCYSSAALTVVNNGAVPTVKGEKPSELCTILYVGGLVGSLGGNMVDCVHDADGVISLSSTSPVTDDCPYIAGYVGGLVGLQGNEATDASASLVTEGCVNNGPLSFNMTGTAKADRFGNKTYAKSAVVGGVVGYSMASFSDCKNTAEINTGVCDADGNAVIQEAHGAVNTGGIVGSLRGPAISNPASSTGVVGSDATDPGYDVWRNSDGATTPSLLSVIRCENNARIIGLASVGGIVGNGGAFTEIIGCANAGRIDGTRSTKPCPAGIVGITNGDIGYCLNTGRVNTTTGAGYYASGIVGLLTTYNTSSTPVNEIMDAPELYGCYVTGFITSTTNGGYRSAVLAGESDGYVHDNCYLPDLTTDKSVPEDWQPILDAIEDGGSIAAEKIDDVRWLVARVNALEAGREGFPGFTVQDGKLVGGTKSQLESYCVRCEIIEKDHNRGTIARNYELTSEELKGSMGVAYLNRAAGVAGDWSESAFFYLKAADTKKFPVLNWQGGGAAGTTDVGAATVTVASDPQYSAKAAPVPTLDVTLDGAKLYQNADYVVVVDPDAKVTGQSYQVKIQGINAYTGTCEPEGVSYTIQPCDVSTCTISATPSLFNWEKQRPKQVKIIDDNGQAHSAEWIEDATESTEFVWRIPENASADGTLEGVDANDTAKHDGKYLDYTHVHSASYRYDITVEVRNSANYTGSTTQPAYHINWAQLTYGPQKADDENRDPTAIYDKVVYGDQEWDYLEATKTKGYVKIKYTGSSIEPTIKTPTYLGKTLRNGTGQKYWDAPLDYDYRYVYGNPNPDPSNVKSFDCINVTGSEETNLACMAIRFTVGGDFDNYSNVFFEITPASMADDVNVIGAGQSFLYAGAAIRPFVLQYNGMTLEEGKDYTVTYANNVECGTATATFVGKGNYKGTATARFTIYDTAARASAIDTAKVTAAQIKHASNLGITSITLGSAVKSIDKNAFKGTKVKTLVVKSKKLKKKSVKGALKGSKVKTVKVNVGSKKVNKKYVKKYKKFFTKANCGKKVKVK